MGNEGGLAELAPWRHRYVDRALSFASDPPQSGCAAMTQVSARPAREHSGHPLGFAGLDGPSNGIDVAASAMESATRKAVRDRMARIAEPDELFARDLPVLACRNGPNGRATLLL